VDAREREKRPLLYSGSSLYGGAHLRQISLTSSYARYDGHMSKLERERITPDICLASSAVGEGKRKNVESVSSKGVSGALCAVPLCACEEEMGGKESQLMGK